MNIKRLKYLIVSENEDCFFVKMYDWSGGTNYQHAVFNTDYNKAKQFSYKKLAINYINDLLKCIDISLESKKRYKLIKLPKVKIIKYSFSLEDVK